MKVKMLLCLFLTTLIFLVNSCEDKQALPSGIPPGCDTASLTYSIGAGVMQQIINANCATANCHVPGGTAPTDFTSYTGLQRDAGGGTNSLFWQNLFVNRSMPPASQPRLDLCSQAKLKQWILIGIPQ